MYHSVKVLREAAGLPAARAEGLPATLVPPTQHLPHEANLREVWPIPPFGHFTVTFLVKMLDWLAVSFFSSFYK